MTVTKFKKLILLISMVAWANCYPVFEQNHASAASLLDYQHSAISAQTPWITKLKRIAHGSNEKFRILQIGDSHTAGDFFTHQLRTRLQQQWGNGGLGWVYPYKVSGQRMATVNYEEGSGWQVFTSRKDNMLFPMGGVVARSGGISFVSLNNKQETLHNHHHITFTVKPILAEYPIDIIDGQGNVFEISIDPENMNWQYLSIDNVGLPIQYQTHPGDIWELGYINIENNQPGIIVSAMGINGAQWNNWSKWRPAWTRDLAETKADLIIIAYGTNEAFDDKFDVIASYQQWSKYIDLIRDTLPEAGILIIGAPESLQNRRGGCGTRAVSLTSVQQQQKYLAEKKGLLYWSWQEAMGGHCSMKKWIQQGLGRTDGVHFSAQGYQQAADDLADAIIQMVNQAE